MFVIIHVFLSFILMCNMIYILNTSSNDCIKPLKGNPFMIYSCVLSLLQSVWYYAICLLIYYGYKNRNNQNNDNVTALIQNM